MKVNRRILLFAFGTLMFTSLVYEVVWTRQITLVFGTTVYALSAVLTSFMAGLSLGSYICGMEADKRTNLLRVFAKLEIVLGAYSIMSIPLLGLLQYPYLFLYGIFGSSPLMAISIFVLTFMFLIVPTAIIGAAFPIMSKIYTREISIDISDIYSVDMAAGGFGALLAGFVFLPYLGLLMTTLMAAIINISVGYSLHKGAA